MHAYQNVFTKVRENRISKVMYRHKSMGGRYKRRHKNYAAVYNPYKQRCAAVEAGMFFLFFEDDCGEISLEMQH